MAIVERENPLGFVDKRRTPASTRNTSTTLNVSTEGNYTSVGALRTRLAALNATYYTGARMNKMTKNDLVYALRLADDAAGI